jgi:hypothetical protein
MANEKFLLLERAKFQQQRKITDEKATKPLTPTSLSFINSKCCKLGQFCARTDSSSFRNAGYRIA